MSQRLCLFVLGLMLGCAEPNPGLNVVLSSSEADSGSELASDPDAAPLIDGHPDGSAGGDSEIAADIVPVRDVDARDEGSPIPDGIADTQAKEVDASPQPDVSDGASDAVGDGQQADGTSGAGPAPTWWQCRRAFMSGQLDEAMTSVCDALHTTAPLERRYGIRWVFLADVQDPQAFVASRMSFLNQIFEPLGFSYEVASLAVLPDPVIHVGVQQEPYPLSALIPDIGAHLELEQTEPAPVLNALKERLAKTGVSAQALEKLTLESPIKSQQFLQIMARARPEVIHVMVETQVSESGGAGGMSSPPGISPIISSVSVVNLSASDDVGVLAFPHEVGHFFGLKHPHGTKMAADQQEIEYDLGGELDKIPQGLDSITALTAYLGDGLDGEFVPPYPAYTNTQAAMKGFREIRYGAMHLWLDWRYMYRYQADQPVPVSSLLGFLQAYEDTESLYRKNLSGKAGPGNTGNNCFWDDVASMFACQIGNPPQLFFGDSQMLDGSLFLDGGQTTNIMSYIGKVVSPTVDNPMGAFTVEQHAVLRTHANTPVRLMLRNLALGDPL